MIHVVRSFALVMFLSIVILFFDCCTGEAIIPPVKNFYEKVKTNNLSEFSYSHIAIGIPNTWNFLFEEDDNAIVTFANEDENIKGKVLVYNNPANNKNYELIFKKYLQDKGNIKFEWMSKIDRDNCKGWMAKGSMEVTENIIEGIVKNYTIYLALYSYKNSIYEIVMVGQGKGLDYKKEAFQIINSVRFNANNNKIIWKSHGLKIMDLDEWVSKSTKKNEIISWTHNKEPVILIISFNKKIKGKQDFKTEVKKAINDFRVYLIKISYKYEDFEIITGSVSKENTRAVVFHAVGKMNNKKIGVRKYYFTNKNHLYDVEIWYSKKDWEEGISKIVDKTLKSIEFER